MWITFASIGAVVLIIAGAVIKIVREKKKGVKCIGCPYAQECAKKGMTSCNEHTLQKND